MIELLDADSNPEKVVVIDFGLALRGSQLQSLKVKASPPGLHDSISNDA